MAVKTIDRAGLRVIQERVLAHLKELGTELGVTFTNQKGMYGGATGSMTLGIAVADASGEAQSVPEAEFKRFAGYYGLEADDLGREFEVRGTIYTLIGAGPSARKYPLLGRNRAGTVYKFSVETVKAGLRPKPTALPTRSAGHSVPSSAAATGRAASAFQDRMFG